jgi:hypothetical protein
MKGMFNNAEPPPRVPAVSGEGESERSSHSHAALAESAVHSDGNAAGGLWREGNFESCSLLISPAIGKQTDSSFFLPAGGEDRQTETETAEGVTWELSLQRELSTKQRTLLRQESMQVGSSLQRQASTQQRSFQRQESMQVSLECVCTKAQQLRQPSSLFREVF